MTTIIRDLDHFRALAGVELGPTEWYDVTQERVDAFSRDTGDFSWIHQDVKRARASELGGTIAQGLYTLSLGPKFLKELLSFERISPGLNYGYDRVRFPAVLPVGDRVRMHMVISSVTDASPGVTVAFTQTFEHEGAEKPVCVAVALSRFTDQ